MKTRVLILCTGNSARSQMAEGLLRALAGDRFEVHSAGTKPGMVRPEAIAAMRESGIDISTQRSKPVDEFAGRNFDYILTVCDHARDACPVFPGDAKRIHWSVEDPAAATGPDEIRLAAFRRIRDELRHRFSGFLAIDAVHRGDVETLEQILDENPELARERIDGRRTLLHSATDWPGHFPNVRAIILALVARGAEIDAHVISDRHAETALHGAVSSDDLDAADALLDSGANIEAPGSIIGGGTPLADAVAFGQWNAARRLMERGAKANLWQAAALGLMSRVEDELRKNPPRDEITNALWSACHGGQRETAELLVERGADLNWIGHNHLTPLDAAVRSQANDLAAWLRTRGAVSNH